MEKITMILKQYGQVFNRIKIMNRTFIYYVLFISCYFITNVNKADKQSLPHYSTIMPTDIMSYEKNLCFVSMC